MSQEKIPNSTGRRYSAKALLGAAGIGALIVAAAPVGGWLDTSRPAIAQSLSQTGPANPPALAPVSFGDVVDRVKPAVVSVRVKIGAPARQEVQNREGDQRSFTERFGIPDGHPLERFFREFSERPGLRGGPGVQPEQPRRFGQSQGSGFFISEDGYVVTNNHVVENATEVEIVTDDDRTLTAKVVGTDPKTDLALLKVDGGKFPYVSFAGGAPRVGDWVVAVGNPFGLGGTVTAGIVSARARDIGAGPYDDFLQIDAAVNRGNSGGPAFNLKGEVVGVNTAIASPSGGNVGIAFAISSETAQSVIAQLRESGKVARGYLGVQIQPVTKEIADSLGLSEARGAIVARVESGSPAEKAGIRTGDAILNLNGEPISNARELSREVANIKPDSDAKVTVWRDGRERELNVRVALMPGEQKTAAASSNDNPAGSVWQFGLRLAPAGSVPGVETKGVVVVGVEPGSQAAEKGMRTGDVIAEVGGKAVETPADINAAIAASRKDGRRAVLMRLESERGPRFVALPIPAA